LKVLYAIAANLGRGIGWTAQNAISGARKCGAEIDTFTLEDVPDLVNSAMKDIFFDHRLCEIVETSMEQYDILHVWNSMGLESIKAAKEKGVKVIVERASTHPEHQLRVLESEYSNAIDPITMDRMLKELELADMITVPSEFASQTYGHLENKVKIIPFGVDSEHFQPKPQGHDLYRVLFAGDNVLRKGIRYMLDAWTLAGKYWELWIKTNIRLGNLPGNIKLISEVPDMADLYNQADVFCLPTVEEGQALVVWEAMACGLPCVVTREAGSLIEDGVSGIIIPAKNSKAIYQALQDLMLAPLKRDSLGDAARRLAEQYPWERYGRSLHSAYEELVK